MAELRLCRCGSDELGHGYSYPPMVGMVQCHTCDAVITADSEDEAIAAWNAAQEEKDHG